MNSYQDNAVSLIKQASEVFALLSGQQTGWLGNGIEIDKLIIEIAKIIQLEKESHK